MTSPSCPIPAWDVQASTCTAPTRVAMPSASTWARKAPRSAITSTRPTDVLAPVRAPGPAGHSRIRPPGRQWTPRGHDRIRRAHGPLAGAGRRIHGRVQPETITMPYKSKAQEAYFNANRGKLESQGVNVNEWNQASKGKKLPERVKAKSRGKPKGRGR